MFLDKEYFDGWMQRLSDRLERIEKLCAVSYTHLENTLEHSERKIFI